MKSTLSRNEDTFTASVLLHIALYLVPYNFQDLEQVLEHKDGTISLHCRRTLIALHFLFHIFEHVEQRTLTLEDQFAMP